MTTFSFDQARELFQPFFSRVQESNPIDLAQRTLDRKRSQKLAKYVIDGLSHTEAFYVLPPIMVTLDIPSEAFFEFQSIDLEGSAIDNLGMLVLPPTTTFWIPDGQHRAFGSYLSLLQAPGLVREQSFGAMLMPDTGGKKRQQIFLDTNQHSIKPNKSIISLFDHRDEASEIARAVLMNVPVFCDRTALEATNLQSKTGDFFTMNALRDACKLLLANYQGEGDRQQRATTFWSAVANHHPHWQQVGDAGLVLRQSSISFTALAINALAIVGAARPQDDSWISRLGNINWSIDNPAWNGLCRFNGRIVKNNVTIRALANMIEELTD